MKAGIYKGWVVVGGHVGESSQAKTLFFTVELLHTPSQQYMDYTVYLKQDSDEAVDRAKKELQKLRDLGFKGRNLADLANDQLKITDLFGPPIAEIEVTVEEEVIVKVNKETGAEEAVVDSLGNPKMRSKIKWLSVGGSGRFDHKQAVAKFSSLKFDALLAGINAGMPSGTPQPGPLASTPLAQQTAANANSGASSGPSFANQNVYQAGQGGASFANDDIPF